MHVPFFQLWQAAAFGFAGELDLDPGFEVVDASGLLGVDALFLPLLFPLLFSGRASRSFSRSDIGVLEGALVTARALTHLRHLSAGFLLLVRVHEGWSTKTWMSSFYRGFMSLDPSIIQKVFDHLP